MYVRAGERPGGDDAGAAARGGRKAGADNAYLYDLFIYFISIKCDMLNLISIKERPSPS
eukprot:COSAG06_NODE_18259_length_895_cov_14.884422_2_plen_59_part_00